MHLPGSAFPPSAAGLRGRESASLPAGTVHMWLHKPPGAGDAAAAQAQAEVAGCLHACTSREDVEAH